VTCSFASRTRTANLGSRDAEMRRAQAFALKRPDREVVGRRAPQSFFVVFRVHEGRFRDKAPAQPNFQNRSWAFAGRGRCFDPVWGGRSRSNFPAEDWDGAARGGNPALFGLAIRATFHARRTAGPGFFSILARKHLVEAGHWPRWAWSGPRRGAWTSPLRQLGGNALELEWVHLWQNRLLGVRAPPMAADPDEHCARSNCHAS